MADFFRAFFIAIGINCLLLSIYDLHLSAKADDPQQKKYQRGHGLCRLLIGAGTAAVIPIEFLYRPLPVFAALYLRKKYGIGRKK